MSTKTKKKICWNCEGNVTVDSEICPYCGVHVNNTPIPGLDLQANQHINSPFKYTTSNDIEKSFPKAPYPALNSEPLENSEPPGEASKSIEDEQAYDSLQQSLLTLIALLVGSVLVLFGLILFLFSNSENLLTLSWNGKFWFIYTLLGIPLLYLGWRSFSKMVE